MEIRVVVFILFSWVLLGPAVASGDNVTIQDRIQISDQIAKYAQLWDRKDSDAFSDLFTEDGVMERYVAGVFVEEAVVKGRSNILTYAKESHAGRLADRQSRHHFTGVVFEELSETEALTENTFMVTHQLAGKEPFLVATGVYRISWRKTEEGWLMANRKLFVDR